MSDVYVVISLFSSAEGAKGFSGGAVYLKGAWKACMLHPEKSVIVHYIPIKPPACAVFSMWRFRTWLQAATLFPAYGYIGRDADLPLPYEIFKERILPLMDKGFFFGNYYPKGVPKGANRFLFFLVRASKLLNLPPPRSYVLVTLFGLKRQMWFDILRESRRLYIKLATRYYEATKRVWVWGNAGEPLEETAINFVIHRYFPRLNLVALPQPEGGLPEWAITMDTSFFKIFHSGGRFQIFKWLEDVEDMPLEKILDDIADRQILLIDDGLTVLRELPEVFTSELLQIWEQRGGAILAAERWFKSRKGSGTVIPLGYWKALEEGSKE